jgi:hypothetical protein
VEPLLADINTVGLNSIKGIRDFASLNKANPYGYIRQTERIVHLAKGTDSGQAIKVIRFNSKKVDEK